MQQVNAQKKQDITFYKKGKKISSKDSADFIRIVQEPDSGNQYLDFFEFYSDGKKRAQAKISWAKYPGISFEGQYISYYRNGNKERTVFYEKSRLNGPAFYFFENGTLRQTLEYVPSKSNYNSDKLIKYQADSLGQVMVKDGNGHIVERSKEFGGSVMEGDYKDGLKHGYWTMKTDSGNCWYKELYEKGKFISGESEKDGVKHSYTEMESMPAPKGGMQRLYAYLKWAIRYPKDAMKNDIQGKVYLSFTVDKDGTTADVKVERSLYPSLDSEAMRVIEQAPRWVPGRQHGFPIKVRYNIPISFSLNGQRNPFQN
ncbi:TonB family protein [Pedobacter africanus]|nr:TonB family protein [Pedobacter africanus]